MTDTKPTPPEVIDRLFSRLAATYGAEWTRQWAGVPMTDVKTAWGHELSGYMRNLAAIAHALDNLPDRCPNVIQFRNLCRSAPARAVPVIEAPKASPERVATELAKLAPATAKTDGREWARRIIGRHEQGDKIRPHSLSMARSALRLDRVGA